MPRFLVLVVFWPCLAVAGCGGGGPSSALPRALPFEFSRPAVGEPIGEPDIQSLTDELTGFWQDTDFFVWLLETSHGNDSSTGKPDYLIYWDDVDAIKQGDTVTFKNASRHGGSHNNAEPTALLLAQALSGHLLTGDPAMGEVAEQYAKSITALMKGFVYDESDPLLYITSRNIITQNHAFTLPSGKKKAVDYSDWYSSYEGWNAARYHYPRNPTFGDVWVTTMRSKDDVHAMYRAAAWLPYLAEEGRTPEVREAAREALEFMRGFAKDIVDAGYHIRSKDAQGRPFIPDQDLASFVDYLEVFPDAECDARLASALLATGQELGLDCGSGQGSGYDPAAGAINYYNYAIIDGFHMAAVLLSLVHDRPEIAEPLLRGLAVRIERYRDPNVAEAGKSNENWERDIAILLLEAAAVGLPLTADEARQVGRFLRQSIAAHRAFPNWDLWDPAVPDGVYDFRSGYRPAASPQVFRACDMAFVLEYCFSPFRNPAGAHFVDCARVKDLARWGR